MYILPSVYVSPEKLLIPNTSSVHCGLLTHIPRYLVVEFHTKLSVPEKPVPALNCTLLSNPPGTAHIGRVVIQLSPERHNPSKLHVPLTSSLYARLPVPIPTFHQSLANITLPRFVPEFHPGYHQFMRTSFPGRLEIIAPGHLIFNIFVLSKNICHPNIDNQFVNRKGAVTLASPFTSSFANGPAVPIPTFPFTNKSFVNLPVPATSSLYARLPVPIPTLPLKYASQFPLKVIPVAPLALPLLVRIIFWIYCVALFIPGSMVKP